MIGPPIAELFAMVEAGQLNPVVGATYAMTDVRQAHEDIRSRKTFGKLVLDPTR